MDANFMVAFGEGGFLLLLLLLLLLSMLLLLRRWRIDRSFARRSRSWNVGYEFRCGETDWKSERQDFFIAKDASPQGHYRNAAWMPRQTASLVFCS